MSDGAERPLPVCSICKLPYTGYGNNAAPVPIGATGDGRCCNACNITVVVPLRVAQYFSEANRDV